jgi:hypothetical protein
LPIARAEGPFGIGRRSLQQANTIRDATCLAVADAKRRAPRQGIWMVWSEHPFGGGEVALSQRNFVINSICHCVGPAQVATVGDGIWVIGAKDPLGAF